jgi:cholesterol oxidase
MNEPVDFTIIGSGFGGSVSAMRLAEKGYQVLVLERGKRYTADTFPKTNWNIFKYLWLPAVRCFGIMGINFLDDMMILNGSGVGGGSLVYASTHIRPGRAFYQAPEWRDLADWEAELAPHFDTAEQMLGVTLNPRLWPADHLLREIAEELGQGHTFKPTPVAIYFGEPGQTVPDPYFDGEGPARAGCMHCGGCMVGCRHNAKNTLDKNYLYFAEQYGATVAGRGQCESIFGRFTAVSPTLPAMKWSTNGLLTGAANAAMRSAPARWSWPPGCWARSTCCCAAATKQAACPFCQNDWDT